MPRASSLLWWPLAVALSVGAVVHAIADDTTVLLAALHALAGYAWVGAAALVAAALPSRRLGRLLWSGALLLVFAAWTAPGTLARHRDAAPALTIATANVLHANPDPHALIAELARLDADVIVLQEVTPRWAAALDGALADHPHRLVHAEELAFGLAVLSRRPLDGGFRDLHGVAVADVTVDMDGRALRILGVHAVPPAFPGYARVWHAQLATLARVITDSPTPIVVAGDLNATRHHPSYRRLLRAGLRDAHAEVGRAAAHTWHSRALPTLGLRLDHVLVGRGIDVVGVREGQAIGTDHRPVVVDLAWGRPRSSTAATDRSGFTTSNTPGGPIDRSRGSRRLPWESSPTTTRS